MPASVLAWPLRNVESSVCPSGLYVPWGRAPARVSHLWPNWVSQWPWGHGPGKDSDRQGEGVLLAQWWGGMSGLVTDLDVFLAFWVSVSPGLSLSSS